MQRLELQRSYAQNVTEPVQEEEEIHWAIKILGEIVIEAAEAYSDAMQENRVKQEAYNRGVRQGQAAQRTRCNNQQGNC